MFLFMNCCLCCYTIIFKGTNVVKKYDRWKNFRRKHLNSKYKKMRGYNCLKYNMFVNHT